MFNAFKEALLSKNREAIAEFLDDRVALKFPDTEPLFNKASCLTYLENLTIESIAPFTAYLSFHYTIIKTPNNTYMVKIKYKNNHIISLYADTLDENMTRYRVDFRYDGTLYEGYQRQPKAKTVQRELESVLSHLMQTPITVHAASRTDAGVHALHQVLHFDANTPLSPSKIKTLMNTMLPDDIVVDKVDEVPSVFHARYDAVSKTYSYRISHEKNPFNAHYVHYLEPLSVDTINSMLEVFIGTHDFASFAKVSDKKDTIRTIFEAQSVRKNNETIIEITGSGFLRNMVRMLIGEILYDYKHRTTSYLDRLERPSSKYPKRLAPAQGLYLKSVHYT